MIVSHSKKFVFLRVTKTGSSTAMVMMRLGVYWDYDKDHLSSAPGWHLSGINLPPEPDPLSKTWRHATLQALVDHGVLTDEQLRTYDIYAFVRNPYERFVSGYYHTTMVGDLGKSGLNAQQFLDRRKLYPGKSEYFTPQIVGRPQHLWFTYKGRRVVKPLCFDHYDDEIRFMLKRCGGWIFPEIPVINRSQADYRCASRPTVKQWGAELALHPEIKKEIEHEYKEDFDLYEMARNDAELRHGKRVQEYHRLGPSSLNLSHDADSFMEGSVYKRKTKPPPPVPSDDG